MVSGQPGSSNHDTVVTRVPKLLVRDITEYASNKYRGEKISFKMAAINYVFDSKAAREALNKKGGSKFL